MESVKLDPNGYAFGEHAAAGRIPFGAGLQYGAADKEVVGAVTATTLSCVGIAEESAVEMDTPGFYEDGDAVSIVTGGPCRIWLVGGEVINAGQYLRLSTTLGAGTENLGVFVPASTPDTRSAACHAKAIGGNVGSADYDQVITTATSGSKTVTFGSAAIVTNLGVAVDDYILLDDNDGAEINLVTAVGTTTITLQNAMVNTYDATPKAYLLKQVEVELI